MPRNERDEQLWERAEVVFENELWLIIDLRSLESFQITSQNGGFAFTIAYEEWSDFTETVRLMQTQAEAVGDILTGQKIDVDGESEWQFTILYPDHTLMFFLAEGEWEAFQEAVEAAADYPWSPRLHRVDVAAMREKVAEQRRWLAKRDRQSGDQSAESRQP